MEDKPTINVLSLAKLCGITDRHVQRLAKEGVFVRVSRGEYDLEESIQNYIDSIKAPEVEGEIDVQQEEARTMRANREIAETKAALMKGRVVETEAVMHLVGEVFTLVRNRYLSLTDRLIPEIVPPEQVVQAKQICNLMIREILTELSISGDAITEKTDFKRVGAPVKPSDVEIPFSTGDDISE